MTAHWATYGLEDFVLFSPRVYWRLFELHNLTTWPAHLVAAAVAALCLVALLRPTAPLRIAAFLALGAVWAWIGSAFFGDRYATINWAAGYVAPIFMGQGLLLALMSILGRAAASAPLYPSRTAAGLALVGYGLFLHPFVAMLAGRPWREAEIFGVAPDPTAFVTLGMVVIAVQGRAAWILCAIPAAWCLASALTLFALGSEAYWIPLGAAVVGILACGMRHRPASAR